MHIIVLLAFQFCIDAVPDFMAHGHMVDTTDGEHLSQYFDGHSCFILTEEQHRFYNQFLSLFPTPPLVKAHFEMKGTTIFSL